jgi:hypothetical protein
MKLDTPDGINMLSIETPTLKNGTESGRCYHRFDVTDSSFSLKDDTVEEMG